MGGAQGSMMHPYDDIEITFKELLTIVDTVSHGGKFKEKVDGVNITWKPSIKDATIYIARNKGMMKDPITIDQFEKSLKGHPAAEQFLKGSRMVRQTWTKMMELILQTRMRYAMIDDIPWFNCEIIDRDSPQMLRYDMDALVIHEFQDDDGNEYESKFDDNNTIEKIVQDLIGTKVSTTGDINASAFTIYTTVDVKLNRIKTGTRRDMEAFIYGQMRRYGLAPDNTIQDYIFEKCYKELCQLIDTQDAFEIAMNVARVDRFSLREIKLRNEGDEDKLAIIDEWGQSKNRLKIINRVLRDFKDKWLWWGAQVLRGEHSALIYNKERALSRMNELIDFNVDWVRDNDKWSADYEGFCLSYEKWCDYQTGIPQLIEGIVIEGNNGNLYKITGAFQLQNRITGYTRYTHNIKFQESY